MLTGLEPATTYHYRILATNPHGATETADLTFKTEPALRIVETSIAAITHTCATLKARVNPDGSHTSVRFQYGLGLSYGAETAPVDLGSSNQPQQASAEVCGLALGTEYHFHAFATNPAAPAGVDGPDHPFSTLPALYISATSASATAEAAVLSARINPLALDTEYRFEYLTEAEFLANGESFSGSDPAAKAPEPDADLGSGTEPTLARQLIGGLALETTYRFRLIAHNSSGALEGPARSFTTPGPEAPPACSIATESSPGFRPYLPDCRAYELVNPPFIGGYAFEKSRLSADGQRILLNTLGAFAGTEADPANIEAANYESLRTSSGWRTRAIDPAAAALSWAVLQDATPDFSTTLWFARTPSQSTDDSDLYLRHPDGSFQLAGPTVPPAAPREPPSPQKPTYWPGALNIAGSSRDLSHLFFRNFVEGQSNGASQLAWPGDTTLPTGTGWSLYQYFGTANSEPELVGVTNVGTVAQAAQGAGDPHLNEAAQLISQCGVELGSGRLRLNEGDLYNAVSASGETAFFTAHPGGCHSSAGAEGQGPPVAELYARLHRSQTVAVSEPTAADCSACHTADPQPATFQGASADGSRVFFLTEQELLPENPGQNLYEYDFNAAAGERVTAVSHLTSGEPAQVQGVSRVSEDGSHVYFVAKAVLATAPDALGAQAQAGQDNLYAYDTETKHTAFVATLSLADSEDWQVEDGRPVQATPDGRYLLFTSVADLTPDDTSTVAQLFEYDSQTGELVRVSVGHRDPDGYPCPVTGHLEAGYNCDGNTEDPADAASIHAPAWSDIDFATQEDEGLALSADGSSVVFSTQDPLVSDVAAGCEHAYEYHSSPGAIAQGNVSLLSVPQQLDGGCKDPSAEIDPSARDVLIRTSNPLLPQATNSGINLYDARAEGGFPATEFPLGCEEEHCQPGPHPGPAEPANATEGFTAPPNPPYCKRGFLPRGGKCVKKPNHHKKHHRRSHKRTGRNHGAAK